MKHLKENSDQLIFATTTPPCPAPEHSSKVLVKPERAKEFRNVALRVMKRNGVPINDLHAKILPDLARHQKAVNDVHFKPSGITILADTVATAIRQTLVPPADHSNTTLSIYETEYIPLIKQHCYRCHNEVTHEGGVRVDNLTDDFAVEHERWEAIKEQIISNQMPPEEPFLSGDQRLRIADWIHSSNEKVDWSTYRQAGHVTLPMLNRNEYKNTIRTLFHEKPLKDDATQFDFAKNLSDDGVGDTGFSSDRDSPSLAMTTARMEKYVRITENVLDHYLYTDNQIHYQIEAEEMKATTAILTPTENGIMIKSNRDSLYRRWYYPRTGWYIIDIKAWGERIDNRACAEMVIYLDRDEVGQARLLATRAQPGNYHCLVWIERGHHTLRFRPQRAGVSEQESQLPVPPPFSRHTHHR